MTPGPCDGPTLSPLPHAVPSPPPASASCPLPEDVGTGPGTGMPAGVGRGKGGTFLRTEGSRRGLGKRRPRDPPAPAAARRSPAGSGSTRGTEEWHRGVAPGPATGIPRWRGGRGSGLGAPPRVSRAGSVRSPRPVRRFITAVTPVTPPCPRSQRQSHGDPRRDWGRGVPNLLPGIPRPQSRRVIRTRRRQPGLTCVCGIPGFLRAAEIPELFVPGKGSGNVPGAVERESRGWGGRRERAPGTGQVAGREGGGEAVARPGTSRVPRPGKFPPRPRGASAAGRPEKAPVLGRDTGDTRQPQSEGTEKSRGRTPGTGASPGPGEPPRAPELRENRQRRGRQLYREPRHRAVDRRCRVVTVTVTERGGRAADRARRQRKPGTGPEPQRERRLRPRLGLPEQPGTGGVRHEPAPHLAGSAEPGGRTDSADTDRQHGASGNEKIRSCVGETDTDGQITDTGRWISPPVSNRAFVTGRTDGRGRSQTPRDKNGSESGSRGGGKFPLPATRTDRHGTDKINEKSRCRPDKHGSDRGSRAAPVPAGQTDTAERGSRNEPNPVANRPPVTAGPADRWRCRNGADRGSQSGGEAPLPDRRIGFSCRATGTDPRTLPGPPGAPLPGEERRDPGSQRCYRGRTARASRATERRLGATGSGGAGTDRGPEREGDRDSDRDPGGGVQPCSGRRSAFPGSLGAAAAAPGPGEATGPNLGSSTVSWNRREGGSRFSTETPGSVPGSRSAAGGTRVSQPRSQRGRLRHGRGRRRTMSPGLRCRPRVGSLGSVGHDSVRFEAGRFASVRPGHGGAGAAAVTGALRSGPAVPGPGPGARPSPPGAPGPRPPCRKRRKSRTAFTAQQLRELEQRFRRQRYLSPVDRDALAARLALSAAQVITWFQNRRAKLKRDLEELRADVASLQALPPAALQQLAGLPEPPGAPGTGTGTAEPAELSEEEIDVAD
ncbi:transcription factor LBX2 [Passer montanus]|uniref:transcription factor LBX2 n=1 Tax=Passer montanus TaxID=9160 RepID=UPI0019611391|nr:transcription factor LBX2 [Passer montanus]